MPRARKRSRRQTAPPPEVERTAPDPALDDQPRIPPETGAKSGEKSSVLDQMIANVVVTAIDAVQSRNVPAEEALRGAMEALTAAQKPALELVLNTAKAQAEIVHQLLQTDPAKARALGTEVGGLLAEAIERSPEFVNSLAAGITDLLSSATNLALAVAPAVLSGPESQVAQPPANKAPAGASMPPSQPQQASAVVESVPEQAPAEVAHSREPAPEAPPMTEAQLLDAILLTIAEGYATGLTGDVVAARIRVLYPAAVPTIQQYLEMEDFLVLMWMRQQPAMAEIAKEEKFARFYAELKAGMLSQAV